MSDYAPPENALFAEEVRALVSADKQAPLPRNPVLFYGSSSMRLWSSLVQDFAGVPVINHGFGGSTLADCVREFDRLVVPVQPRAVVLYAGDNDLDQGGTPERVLELFREFMRRVEVQLQKVPVVFISIKPSPSRFWNIANIRRANSLVREEISQRPGMQFLDIFPSMLDLNGWPRRELFTEDGLHMNANGYALWTAAVRTVLAESGLLR